MLVRRQEGFAEVIASVLKFASAMQAVAVWLLAGSVYALVLN